MSFYYMHFIYAEPKLRGHIHFEVFFILRIKYMESMSILGVTFMYHLQNADWCHAYFAACGGHA